MKDILIKATVNDSAEIFEMQIVAFRTLLEKYRDYETNPGAENQEFTVQRMSEPFVDDYFITDGEKNIGALRICNFKKLCCLERIFVLPEFRHRGFGARAINEVIKLYPAAEEWQLETILQENELCRFYENLGFKTTGKAEHIKDGMDIVLYSLFTCMKGVAIK